MCVSLKIAANREVEISRASMLGRAWAVLVQPGAIYPQFIIVCSVLDCSSYRFVMYSLLSSSHVIVLEYRCSTYVFLFSFSTV
jgi:hypothetical protein